MFTGDWEAAWAGLQAMFSGIWDAIVAAVQGIGQILAAVWEGIVSQMSGVISWLNGVFVGAFTGLVGFFSGIWSNITSGITNAWNGVMSFLGSIPGRIKGFFAGIGTWLLDSGRALIQGFIDGIKGMIGAVGDAVGGVMDWASGFFPHSPALRGPFSGTGWVRVEDGGKSLMEQFAAGAEKIRPELKFGALTATAGALSGLAPSTTSTSYAPQITVQSTGKLKDDLEEVAFQLRQMGRGSRR
ncbi:MAG: phage tail protein [Actinomycetota bacterium]